MNMANATCLCQSPTITQNECPVSSDLDIDKTKPEKYVEQLYIIPRNWKKMRFIINYWNWLVHVVLEKFSYAILSFILLYSC